MTVAVEIQDAPPVPETAAVASKPGGGMFKKGFWAIMDQGLFAGSNAVLNILLARWLSPNDFGAYSTAFAAFLGLGVIHTSLLTEPMLVFAPDKYRDHHKSYFGALVHGHLVVSLGCSLVLAIAALYNGYRGHPEMEHALMWFAISGPFILFLWLMRRVCYGQFNPKRAAMGGVLYLFLMMALLAMVHAIGHLNTATALSMLGVSSLVAGVVLGINHVNLRPPGELMRDVVAEHLRYGRFATATQVLGYIPGNIYYFLLPSMASLEQSGALRALSNLFNPLIQANAALCLLLLPAFVRTHGTTDAKRLHHLSLLLLAGAPLVYGLVLGIFHTKVVSAVYHGKFVGDSYLLWILAIQPVIAGMCGVYGSLLRAQQKLNAVLWGGVVAAIGAVVLGIWMTKQFALAGVCWSIVITYGLHHVTLWLFSRGVFDRRSKNVDKVLAGEMLEPA